LLLIEIVAKRQLDVTQTASLHVNVAAIANCTRSEGSFFLSVWYDLTNNPFGGAVIFDPESDVSLHEIKVLPNIYKTIKCVLLMYCTIKQTKEKLAYSMYKRLE
jgi:hypothetical protein